MTFNCIPSFNFAFFHKTNLILVEILILHKLKLALKKEAALIMFSQINEKDMELKY